MFLCSRPLTDYLRAKIHRILRARPTQTTCAQLKTNDTTSPLLSAHLEVEQRWLCDALDYIQLSIVTSEDAQMCVNAATANNRGAISRTE